MNKYLKLLLIPLLLGLIVGGSSLYPQKVQAACGSSYSNCYTVTTVHAKVANTDQTNFPMLFSTSTMSSLATVANGGLVNNTTTFNGQTVPADLIFSSASNCSAAMSYDVEKYVSTTGEIVAWIKIPTLHTGSDDSIYLCLGNSGVTTYQGGSVGAVYDTNYKRVWHMNDNAANTTVIDSTATNNGVSTNNTSGMATSTKIDGNFAMNGTTDGFQTGTVTFPNATSTWTFSAWVKTSATDAAIFGMRDNSGGCPIMELAVGNNGAGNSGTGKPTILVRDMGCGGLTQITSASTINDNAWHYVVNTRTSAQLNTLYVDGVSVASGTDTAGAGFPFNTGASGPYFGDESTNTGIPNFNGSVDEARISFTNRSADWITTEYNNQSSPGTFYVVGPQQSAGGVTAPVPTVYLRADAIIKGYTIIK